MSVTLVRHTRPNVAPGICYGSTNLDVAASFPIDSAEVIKQLVQTDVLISSPMLRCRKLADAIAHWLGIEPNIDERVREMDFGSWENRPWSKVPRDELDEWASDFINARPHGGESVAMLRDRVAEALSDYVGTGLRHIVVTHSGVMKVALARGDTGDDFNATFTYGALLELPQKPGKEFD